MFGEAGEYMEDVGTQILEAVYGQLKVEDEWAFRRQRGFTWWGYRLAQHIDVSLPVHDRGLDSCSLHVRTDVVRDVDANTNPVALLVGLNRQETLNALVWDPSEGLLTRPGESGDCLR